MAAFVRIYVSCRSIYQVATELHSVSIPLATVMAGEAAHESHGIPELSFQNVKGVSPVA